MRIFKIAQFDDDNEIDDDFLINLQDEVKRDEAERNLVEQPQPQPRFFVELEKIQYEGERGIRVWIRNNLWQINEKGYPTIEQARKALKRVFKRNDGAADPEDWRIISNTGEVVPLN